MRCIAKSGRRVADPTSEQRVHTTIVLARLIRKPEEREKDKSAHDKQPAEQLYADIHIRVVLPNGAWDLEHLGIVTVDVGPAFPRCDGLLGIVHYDVRPHWDGPKYLYERKGH